MGGKSLRSYLFDGMKPHEMSRQKFDVLRQPGHVSSVDAPINASCFLSGLDM
jgi:hypothetical protein